MKPRGHKIRPWTRMSWICVCFIVIRLTRINQFKLQDLPSNFDQRPILSQNRMYWSGKKCQSVKLTFRKIRIMCITVAKHCMAISHWHSMSHNRCEVWLLSLLSSLQFIQTLIPSITGIYVEITGKGYCHWRTGSGSNTRRFTGNETYLEEKIFFVGTPDGKFSITVVKVQSKCTCSFVSYRQRSDDRAGRVWLWFQLSATSWAANIIRSTIRLDSIWSACGARYCLVARYRIQRVIYRHQTVQFELWWSIAGKNFTNQVVDSSTKAFDTSYSALFFLVASVEGSWRTVFALFFAVLLGVRSDACDSSYPRLWLHAWPEHWCSNWCRQ